MIRRDRYLNRPIVQVKVANQEKVTKMSAWEKWLRSIGLFLTAGILLMTLYVGYTANKILRETSRAGDKIVREQRAAAIHPILRATARKVDIASKTAQGYIVTLSNIGTGTAKDMCILVNIDGHRLNQIVQNLYPQGTFPILRLPPFKEFRWNPVIPDFGEGQDFIQPEGKMEFQLGCFEYGQMPTSSLTFYISYFDIDGNEYLMVTKQIPGLDKIPVGLNKKHPVWDTLDALSRNVRFLHYRSFRGINFRDSAIFFRRDFKESLE